MVERAVEGSSKELGGKPSLEKSRTRTGRWQDSGERMAIAMASVDGRRREVGDAWQPETGFSKKDTRREKKE